MKLFMDETEILIDYKDAKNKFQQVGILAEQNCCSKKEMAQWLKDHGQDVDGRFFSVGRTKTTKEPEPVQAAPELTQKPDQAAKADAGKPRLTLVPMQILFDIAAIREYGNKKYGAPDNWKNVEPDRFREAAFRHFLRYIDDPAGVDEESGLPHRWHLECNLAFLAEMEKEL